MRRLMPTYPDAKYYMLYVYYGEPREAHAMLAILINGQYYLVDPQTGQVRGPIEEGTWFDPTDFAPALKELLERYLTPGTDPGRITWKRHPPDYIDPNDVRPWYEDPDVRDWWENMFPGQNPDDFIWPTQPEPSDPWGGG